MSMDHSLFNLSASNSISHLNDEDNDDNCVPEVDYDFMIGQVTAAAPDMSDFEPTLSDLSCNTNEFSSSKIDDKVLLSDEWLNTAMTDEQFDMFLAADFAPVAEVVNQNAPEPSTIEPFRVEMTVDISFPVAAPAGISQPVTAAVIPPKIAASVPAFRVPPPPVAAAATPVKTPEHADNKYLKRRHNNNLSAQRSRVKRRELEQANLEKIARLELENAVLKAQILKLEQETENLRSVQATLAASKQ